MGFDPQQRLAECLEQKANLLTYALVKLKAGDYHAVADAAMDLRELDAQLEVLRLICG